MDIKLEDLLKAIEGYGTDSQPLTIGILKYILLDIQNKNIKNQLKK